MGRLKVIPDVLNAKDLDDLKRFVGAYLKDLGAEFNGKVDFVDNIRAQGPITLTFGGAGEVVTINHNLARTPIGYIVVSRSANIGVFDATVNGQTKNDKEIYFQASAAGTAAVIII